MSSESTGWGGDGVLKEEALADVLVDIFVVLAVIAVIAVEDSHNLLLRSFCDHWEGNFLNFVKLILLLSLIHS